MSEMNLKDFVSSTISQIVEGVAEAINRTPDNVRSFVNPVQMHVSHSDAKEIEFDVAVTVTSQVEGEGRAKISVLGINIGGGVDSLLENQAISRISFKVPVAWPSVAVEQYPQRSVSNRLSHDWK